MRAACDWVVWQWAENELMGCFPDLNFSIWFTDLQQWRYLLWVCADPPDLILDCSPITGGQRAKSQHAIKQRSVYEETHLEDLDSTSCLMHHVHLIQLLNGQGGETKPKLFAIVTLLPKPVLEKMCMSEKYDLFVLVKSRNVILFWYFKQVIDTQVILQQKQPSISKHIVHKVQIKI